MSEINRSRTRKLLFQRLYSRTFDTNCDNKDTFFENFYNEIMTFGVDHKYFDDIYKLVIEKESILVEIIKKYAHKFDPEKMNRVYVLAIFIGTVEMLFAKEEIPGKVSINEAVEIAKIYGDEAGKRIVNGVLNKVYENHESLIKEIPNLEVKTIYTIFAK